MIIEKKLYKMLVEEVGGGVGGGGGGSGKQETPLGMALHTYTQNIYTHTQPNINSYLVLLFIHIITSNLQTVFF